MNDSNDILIKSNQATVVSSTNHVFYEKIAQKKSNINIKY